MRAIHKNAKYKSHHIWGEKKKHKKNIYLFANTNLANVWAAEIWLQEPRPASSIKNNDAMNKWTLCREHKIQSELSNPSPIRVRLVNPTPSMTEITIPELSIKSSNQRV